MDANGIRALVEQLQQAVGPTSTITVGEIAERYIAGPELAALRSIKTELGRIKHLVRLLGARQAATLSAADVAWYRAQRKAERFMRRRTTKPATRNREVVRLSAMLGIAAEEWKLIPDNPLAGVAMEPENNERHTTRSLEELRLIVEALDQVTGAIVATSATSGLRRAEVVRLRKDRLHRIYGRIELHGEDTKTRRPRKTILSAWATALIDGLPPNTTEFVFVSRLGRPFNPRTVLRRYQRVCRVLGIKAADGESNWFHDLRSHFIDEQLELATPERDIRDMSGHSHLNTSAFERYVRRRRHNTAVALAKVNLDRRLAAMALGPRKPPGRIEPKGPYVALRKKEASA